MRAPRVPRAGEGPLGGRCTMAVSAAVAMCATAVVVAADPANQCRVSLVQQLSHGACISSETFGCSGQDQMWVKNCSGEFRCGSPSVVTKCMSIEFANQTCSCRSQAPSPPSPAGPIIGGFGDFKYQYMPNLLQMPAGAEVQHAHGLETDREGNIYVTYVNWNNGINNNGTDQHCLVRWMPDGTNGTFLDLGGTGLCDGTPHGLKIASEDGEQYLYHANCATQAPRYGSGKITKTTLDGQILWQHVGPFGQPKSLYRPTWWALPPDSEYIYLADGYGSSNVYVFTRDGKFQNRTFGGKGTEHGKFNNCHGIGHDPRSDKLVVADRENHRIEIFDFDSTGSKFAYDSTLVPGWGTPGTQRPCNFRVIENATNSTLNGLAVIADLGANDQSSSAAAKGQVAILSKNNTLLSVIAVSELIGDQGSIHPHDAHFLPNGDIVVATWNPGRISYWKLLQ